jgi:hypothetical protein
MKDLKLAICQKYQNKNIENHIDRDDGSCYSQTEGVGSPRD